MWNIPSQERLSKIPRLYETENQRLEDKLIYLHFFMGKCDWYISEFDGDDTFFGYAILNGDYNNADWGYISFSELIALKTFGHINQQTLSFLEVDCELDYCWEIRQASKIDQIQI